MRSLPLAPDAGDEAPRPDATPPDATPPDATRPAHPALRDAAPLVAVRGLTVHAGGRELLSHVDMAVYSGEIVTVIGPNGAGKTTLVRALLGIARGATGAVKRMPGLRVGYLPQRLQIDATLPLTVTRLLALARPVNRSRIATALEEVGAAQLAGRMLGELSGGEFQRVLLARALVRDPQLLVLDEPVQGVDVSGQLDLYALIAHIRRERGCGILLISHDLHLVMSATDRVICLNGHVCCAGRPDSVVRDPAFLNLFGPRAAAGLAIYAHAHGHNHSHDHTHAPADGVAEDRGGAA